jgi:hypothetical protein
MFKDREVKSQISGQINIIWKCPKCDLLRVLKKRPSWAYRQYHSNTKYRMACIENVRIRRKVALAYPDLSIH